MQITWNGADPLEAPCPVCCDRSAKPVRLSVRSAVPPQPILPLVVCGTCGTAFFPTLSAVAYEETGSSEAALAFYLEQGASIEAMAEPIESVETARVKRYLEIGCGYGLSLDYARTMFGWEVYGIDPGFAARAGREALGLEISSTYLRSSRDAGHIPFDLVLCSEVIEHIFAPVDFLDILRELLSSGGTLLLTTPNARMITETTPLGTLVPLLSPGYHVTLYSQDGLERLLRQAGFGVVSVIEQGATLRAAAGMTCLAADLERRLDRKRYRDYLARRADGLPGDSPLALGLRYRQVKEMVHAGDYALADAAMNDVAVICRQHWGHDFTQLNMSVLSEPAPDSLDAYHVRYPFCACGILYFSAMLAWQHDHDHDLARRRFLAAAIVGERLRAVLQCIGADDGETDELVWRAIGNAAHILASTDPEATVEEVHGFGLQPSPLLGETMPASIAVDLRREIFVTLINLGHYAAADRLAEAVRSELPVGLVATTSAASVTFALGIFSLNYLQLPKDAASWFAQAYESSVAAAKSAPADAQSLQWWALYHQALALVHAGKLQEAARPLRLLLRPRSPGLLEVFLEILRQAKQLARKYGLSI